MEIFNRNENTTKKKKHNRQAFCCFGHCCRKKKQQQNLIETTKILNEKTMKNRPLKQSEFLNESIFCGNITEIYHDPCVELTVQNGPDISENIMRKSAKLNTENTINDNNESKQSANDIIESYNWDLAMNSSDIHQHFEPYNWNDSQYSIPLQDKSSKRDQSQANDKNEESNHSFSTSTISSSNKRQKIQSFDNNLKISRSTNTNLNSQQSFSTAVFHETPSSKQLSKVYSDNLQTKSNTFNQVRATYDDLIISCRYLLERFLNFMITSRHSNHQITTNTSSSISMLTTYSWSTMISNETLNFDPFHNLGPWWSRRDKYDQMPATFLFSDEPLINDQQICFLNCSNYHQYCNSS